MKKAFYHIVSHLKSEKDHLAKILLGPACEHWLRSESSYALNFNRNKDFKLSNNEYVFEEDKKRDITFFDINDNPTRILEIKAVYPLGEYNIKEKWLKPLRKQLIKREPGEKGISATGLIFGIWSSYFEQKISERIYYQKLTQLTKDIFEKDFTTQHGYKYETILTEYKAKWLKTEYSVSIKALYLTKKT